MNQTQNRHKGNILRATLGCAALFLSLTAPFALAQNDAETVVPAEDVEAIEAAVQSIPSSSSTVLDALSDAARAEVERFCLPVQYQSGAVAYRECISAQLDSEASQSPVPVSTTTLSFDEEFAIQQTCRATGAVNSAAYHACDEKQVASLAGVPEPALELISEDETFAVQLGCYDIQTNDGVKAYRECLNETIRQLLALPSPELATLTLVDRNALQLRCSVQNSSATAYRNCLLEAVGEATMANQAVDIPVDAPGIQNDVEPAVEPAGQNLVLADATTTSEIADNPEELQAAPPADNEIAAIDAPVVEAAPAVTAEAIRLPTTDSRNQGDTTGYNSSEQAAPGEAEDAGQTPADLLADLQARLRATVAGMSDMTRMLMWAAIALPLLLTLSWLVLRGRKPVPEPMSTYPEYPVGSDVDTAPHRPSSTQRSRKMDDDTAEFARRNRLSRQQDVSPETEDGDDTLDFSTQMDELFGRPATDTGTALFKDTVADLDIAADATPDADPLLESESTPDPVSTLGSDSELRARKIPSTERPPATDFTLAPATERDDYLAWLSVQDESRQQTLAIEFLIYWMAYSDERYPPELKQKIFQLQNPGDHELIKRWTLKQDVHAFAGNLQWVQYNLSKEQHEQIIHLLVALLVSENALTPAQNTLLRFLADAFGLGLQWLEKLFQTGFAHPMPKLPRLDNPGWWKRQSSDILKRWDARSVSRQRSEIRYRVALGLPLGGELDPESIMSSFKRAARRCQPERFNRLSSREQNLVAKQLEKYETAAESLLEVSA